MTSFQNGLRFLWYYTAMMVIGVFFLLKEIITGHRQLKPTDLPDCEGKVVVITGGARGIGLAVVKRLLMCRCHVIIGCRKPDVMESIVEKLRSDGMTGGEAECYALDLMSMESVRKFASMVLMKNIPVHVLINNAGIMFVPYSETVDGFESHFATNYLGHFLLTHLLMPRLREAGAKGNHSRIVSVSSAAHLYGKLDFSDPQMSHWYNPYASYGQSKMAQILFTKYLDARLQSDGGEARVRAMCLHPGIVLTEIHAKQIYMSVVPFFDKYIFKTPEQGADTVLYVALSPEADGLGGNYFDNCQVSCCSSYALNLHNQKQLWDYSCGLLHISKFGEP